ncbi:MAG: IS1595 family transposase [Verrucomicrobia bacterium]|nr:IS1595 family transposase [Verrucomicrobiota bacterium]
MKKTNAKFEAEELNLFTIAREYSDDDKARELLENIRWPNGPVCPHCGGKEAYRLTPRPTAKSPGRKGLLKCKACRKQFTVTVGTIFSDSHIPLGKWLMAIHVLCASKKAVSAHQLHRMLGITYKTAWFMAHRIRYAMSPEMPLGKMLSGVVEADETYVGGKPRPGTGYHKPGRGTSKTPVVALIERGGDVRTKVVANVSQKNLRPFLQANIKKGTTVNTDAFKVYHSLLYPLVHPGGTHEVVNHNAGEYARHNADGSVSHVNTCESFFSLLKRGIYGSWHHVSKEHLGSYCNEFAFRWNNRHVSDGERMVKAVQTTFGKRLTYKSPLKS